MIFSENKRIITVLLCVLILLTLSACGPKKDPDAAPDPSLSPEPSLSPDFSLFPESDETPIPVMKETDGMKPVEGDCNILFIKAGKADSILVCAGGKNYLIDTGEKESAAAVISALNTMGVDRLDAVFLSHTHGDHIGGFDAVAQNIPIERVYRAEFSENKQDGTNKINTLAQKYGIPLSTLSQGDIVLISDLLLFEVAGPAVYNSVDDNDNSLVLRLCCKNTTVLFTGDMQFAEEDSLMKSWPDLSADVIKIGNHGNPDATGEEFIRKVSPSYAVITTERLVDEDSANPRVLELLSECRVYITDETENGVLFHIEEDGTISVSEPEVPNSSLELEIVSVDLKKQTVTIRNNGENADISGVMIFSGKGGELFVFPEGTVIGTGQSVTVAGEGGEGDFQWRGDKSPWSKKKSDPAYLYDKFGALLSRLN